MKRNMNRGTEAVLKEEDEFNDEGWEEQEFDEQVSHSSSVYRGSTVYGQKQGNEYWGNGTGAVRYTDGWK